MLNMTHVDINVNPSAKKTLPPDLGKRQQKINRPFADHATSYLEAGFSPLPLSGKRPVIDSWSDYCGNPLSATEVARLAKKYPKANIGIATGGGLLVIDFDTERAEILEIAARHLPDSPVKKRGNTGFSAFYSDGGQPLASRRFNDNLTDAKHPHGNRIIDVLADGCQTVLPPSIHPDSKKPYTWLTAMALAETVIEDLPVVTQEMLDALEAELRARGFLYEKPASMTAKEFKPRKDIGPLSEAMRNRYRGWVLTKIKSECATLASMGAKSGRNGKANAIVYACGSFVHHGVINLQQLAGPIVAACEANGLNKENGEKDLWSTINRAMGACKSFDLPELEDRPNPKTQAKQAKTAETVYSEPISALADEKEPATEEAAKLSVEDFYALMPTHQYINRHTRELWVAPSVNARISPMMLRGEPTKAATYLDKCRPVDQMTWAPGRDELIKNKIIQDGGWIDHSGSAIFNLYRPPNRSKGNKRDVAMWREHIRKIYPNDADHLEKWLAHRVQRPGDKINHCLVLGGAMGIGKDTLLEPVKRAVGAWNFADVTPDQLLGRFNGFLKSVILRVSEARDLGDSDRYAFYDHTKILMAAPPDVLRIDEKNAREHMIPNVVGLIITTNNKTHGLYLEADDRRHFVAWSELTKADFTEAYWNRFYKWYDNGGIENVAAFLQELDISTFSAKAPPPKTDAFWEIVDANRTNESSELSDAISSLGTPHALTINQLIMHAEPSLAAWLSDRKNSRQMPSRLEEAGYIPVRNAGQKDGRWKVNKKNVAIFALKTLPKGARESAASGVARGAF